MTALRDQVVSLFNAYGTKIQSIGAVTQHLAGDGVVIFGSALAVAETTGEPGVLETETGTTFANEGVGVFTWANILLGHRLELFGGYGDVGNSQHVLSTISATTFATTPRFAIIYDWVSGNFTASPRKTLSDIQTDLNAMIAHLNTLGIIVVLCGPTPNSSVISGDLPAYAAVQRMVEVAGRQPGVIPVNFADVLNSITTANTFRTNYSPNGVALSTVGAMAAGKVLADALRPYVGGSTFLAYGGAPSTLTPNPFLTGTSGTKATGVTGSQADSSATQWTGSAGVVTASKVVREDYGEWQQFRVTGGGTILQFVMTATATVGDVVCAECEFEADDDWVTMNAFSLQLTSGSQAAYDARVVDNLSLLSPGEGVLRTPSLTVATGGTALSVLCNIKGSSGTVRIGRMRIKKVV